MPLISKYFFYGSMTLVSFLQINIARAESSIYFCTRDLDSKNTIDGKNYNSTHIRVTPNIKNDKNKIFRHCFMMYADVLKAESAYHHLLSHFTVGFFMNSYTGKAVIQAEDLKNKVVSCVPVKTPNDSKLSMDLWAKVLNFYKDSISKGYDVTNNNCCSVAYDSISYIDGDYSKIDNRSYNFGIGTIWKFDSNNTVNKVFSLASVGSDQIIYESSDVLDTAHEIFKIKMDL